MSHNVDIHPAQVEILRSLLFSPEESYSALCEHTRLSSDHFNFHIKKLVELDLVTKVGKNYTLTAKGKEHANRLDTDDRTIEKQPKAAVLVLPTRVNKAGTAEFLVQKRLKQPFFGFYVCLTGKIRWGETIEGTAHRELEEETGLKAGQMRLMTIYHKQDYTTGSKKLLEDKIFYCYNADDISGELKKTFEGGENHWLTLEAMTKLEKSMLHPEELTSWLEAKGLTFNEFEFYYDETDY